MRCSGIPLPSVTSGAVTSIPSLTRNGRPSFSFSSSPPSGSTWAALRVSSAMPIWSASLPLQSPASRAAPRQQTGACPPAPQNPQAAPARAPPDLLLARGGVVHVRSRHRDRERDPLARSRPPPETGGGRLHLRGEPEQARARGPAGIAEPDPRPVQKHLAEDEARDRRRRG